MNEWHKAEPLPGDQSIRGQLWRCMFEHEYPGYRIDHVMNANLALDDMVALINRIVDGENYQPSPNCPNNNGGPHRGVSGGPNGSWICGLCGHRVPVDVSNPQ